MDRSRRPACPEATIPVSGGQFLGSDTEFSTVSGLKLQCSGFV